MSATQYFVGGKPLRVGKRIGRGGEGDVYQGEDDPALALKIYKQPDAVREAKILAMTGAGLAQRSALIAFPVAEARDKAGKFVGFTMRLVNGHQPLFELYSPGARKVSFPKADFRFLVRSAANIARAIGQVHEAGVVIGDINHSGILISDQAVAALIDADSFQIGSHLCRVGVPEYTPPELQGVSLSGVSRTPQHDAFGLGVVMFQLLFMGRHPFVGRYAHGEMPIEKAISEYRFAYSTSGQAGMTPPPGACRLSDFPHEIGLAFEAAFGRDPNARPTAAKWVALLHQLEQALRKCSANPLHYYPAAAGSCTWCRMETTVGMILFVPTFTFGVATPIVDPGAGGFDLNKIWAAIQRVQVPNPSNLVPPYPIVDLSISDAAKSQKQALWGRRVIGGIAIILAVGLLFGASQLWLVYVPLAWFGVVQAFSNSTSQGKFPSTYISAEQELERALDDWRRRTWAVEIHARREALREAKARYADLPNLEKKQLDDQERKRRSAQLTRYLDSFPIRRARIRGIGPTREATLASYGIDTAADVTLRAVLAVPGFGEASAQPLIAWRERVERRFVFSVQHTVADIQAAEQVRRNFAAEAAKLRQALLKGANELSAGVSAVQARLKTPDPVVNKAYLEREQARLDLEHLGFALPNVSRQAAKVAALGPTTPTPVIRQHPSKAPVVNACPTCGGQMIRRVARRGRNPGRPFWGCARYPNCRGTRPI